VQPHDKKTATNKINGPREVTEHLRLLLFVLQQEVSEVPLTLPSETLTNGVLEAEEAAESHVLERPAAAMLGPMLGPMMGPLMGPMMGPLMGPLMGPPLASTASAGGAVAAVTREPETKAVAGKAAALVAAARATVSEGELKQRLAAGGHACVQCDRVFMSMQGLRSHERSHSAMALFSREDKYSCQYCQFVSPFRHK